MCINDYEDLWQSNVLVSSASLQNDCSMLIGEGGGNYTACHVTVNPKSTMTTPLRVNVHYLLRVLIMSMWSVTWPDTYDDSRWTRTMSIKWPVIRRLMNDLWLGSLMNDVISVEGEMRENWPAISVQHVSRWRHLMLMCQTHLWLDTDETKRSFV